jgi:hypothetical protein
MQQALYAYDGKTYSALLRSTVFDAHNFSEQIVRNFLTAFIIFHEQQTAGFDT